VKESALISRGDVEEESSDFERELVEKLNYYGGE
jgi:hypothetical protein